MGTEYGIDEKVIEGLVKNLKCKPLKGFTHLFTDASDVKDVVKSVSGVEHVLQTSKVRQAWTGTETAMEEKQMLKRKGLEQENIEALLPQNILDDFSDLFRARYHISCHAQTEPSDYLVFKNLKKLEKRMLQLP